MAVNNPATSDYRVVKSAEMVARAGFDCHVVGVLRPGFKEYEIINGVTYHRVGVKPCLMGFLAGVSIGAFLFFKRNSVPAERVKQTKIKGHKNSIILLSFMRLFNRDWLLSYKHSKVFYFLFKIKRRILSSIRKMLRPECSSIGVRLFLGNYLASFYSKLLMLNGDIYHAHELWMLESCSLVSCSLGKKLVYDSHELEVHRNNNWSMKSNKVRCRYELRYIHHADSVFTVSNGCAREIEKEYGLKDVLLLRNTPLLTGQVNFKVSIREAFNIDAKLKLIIYTGSVTFNRGLDVVLKALVKLHDHALVTVGPWNEVVKDELKKYAAELNVQNRFYMHDKVSPQVLISLISEGDIAIIPIKDACLSYRYCMPNKLFEAAFAGLPIAASNLPDMEEFIVDNELGVVFDSDSVCSLINAINDIENNNIHFKVQSKRENIKKEYCFEKESEILIKKYKELLRERSSYEVAAA